LGKLVSEKKSLCPKSKTTKLEEDNIEYSILKRKVKVEIRKAKNINWKYKCSELQNMHNHQKLRY
jgi:hypothetical protein